MPARPALFPWWWVNERLKSSKDKASKVIPRSFSLELLALRYPRERLGELRNIYTQATGWTRSYCSLCNLSSVNSNLVGEVRNTPSCFKQSW